MTVVDLRSPGLTVSYYRHYAGSVVTNLAVGGAIVFDDIGHPRTLELREVWCRIVADDPRFSSWAFDEVGYGVAFAIRKW